MRSKRRILFQPESLESRRLLSTVSWSSTTGGNWNSPANWSGDALPQPGDDVVINQPGNIQINLNASTSINSLSITGDTLQVSGGTLSVAGATTLNAGAALNMPSGITSGIGTNLIGNPGFESPSTSNSTTAPGTWGQWNYSYASTAAAHSGSQSLLEYGSNSGVYQSFPVSPGVSYSASVWALTPSTNKLTGAQGAFMQLAFTNASGGTVSSPSAWITALNSNSAVNTWINSTASLTAPSSAVSITIYLQVGAYTGIGGTSGGDAYFDDVQLGAPGVVASSLQSASVSNSGTISLGGGDTISTGSFVQTAGGTFISQIGAPAAAGLFGSMAVSGSATLAGKFKASLYGSYAPSISDGFSILSYSSETGSFSTVQLPSGSSYQFASATNPTYFGVSAVPTSLNVSVNATTKVSNSTSKFIGVNLAYWDDLLNTSQTQSMVQAAGLNLFRFPGGSASDDYHFNIAANYGDAAANTIPQFAKFIATAGGTGIITTDYGSGSPQEAEAELAYLTGSTSDTTPIGIGIEWSDSAKAWQNVDWKTVGYWASLRAASPLVTDDGLNFLRINQAAPFTDVNDWEIGNELYGSWETDHHGTPGPNNVSTGAQHDPTTYAAFAAAFAGFDAADPLLPKVLVGIDTGDPTGNSDSNWTRNVVTHLLADGYAPGFLSDHSYMYGPGSENDSLLLTGTVSNPASTLDWSVRYSDYETMLNQVLGTAAASTVQIMATEYNSNYGTEGKQMTSLVNGLFVADSIGSLMSSGYVGGIYWDLRNGWNTTGNNSPNLYGWRQGGDEGIIGTSNPNSPPATGPYVAYPSYFAEQLASRIMQTGGIGLSDSSSYNELSVYPVLEPTGDLALLVINKNPDAALQEQISLNGFSPSGAANIWQYGEAQDYAQSQSSTGAASLASSSTTLAVAGNSVSYYFPAYSMTVLDLSAAAMNVTTGTQTIPAGGASTINLQTVGAVNISPGASVVVAPSAATSGRTLFQTQGLTIAGGGKLDLNNGDLLIQQGNLANVSALAGLGFSTGSSGIISSTARADTTHLTTIGVILNTVNGTPSGAALYNSTNPFDGTSPPTTAVLVKYTYFGDTNLDGRVDSSDYTRIDAGFLNHATGWFNGDFNYDNIINGSDYTLIDNAFNTQRAAITSQVMNPQTSAVANFANSQASVPTTLELLEKKKAHRVLLAI